MKRKIAVLAVTACALAATFGASAPSASATYIQGCVHWNEFNGPWGAFVINAYNRCTGVPIRRAPDVINGPDGGCKRMIPHHLYQWNLWSLVPVPGSELRGWKWC